MIKRRDAINNFVHKTVGVASKIIKRSRVAKD